MICLIISLIITSCLSRPMSDEVSKSGSAEKACKDYHRSKIVEEENTNNQLKSTDDTSDSELDRLVAERGPGTIYLDDVIDQCDYSEGSYSLVMTEDNSFIQILASEFRQQSYDVADDASISDLDINIASFGGGPEGLS